MKTINPPRLAIEPRLHADRARAKTRRTLLAVTLTASLGLVGCSNTGSSETTNPDVSNASTTSAVRPSTTTAHTTTSTTTNPTSTTVAEQTNGSVLPVPDGPFAVGFRALALPSAFAFYPAVAGTGSGIRPYFDPQFLLSRGLEADQFDRAVTSAEIDAQPASAPTARPVVIISSGFGSYLEFSTTLVERLASHGYIVIAVQPAVDAEAVVETVTDEMRDARMAQMTSVLDYLTDPDLPTLIGTVDLDRVAVGGHSYAGSIAFNTAIIDDRVSAVFDLDGSLFDAALTTPAPVPSLIVSAMGGSAQDEGIAALLPQARNTVAVGLTGANHFDLTDMPCLVQDPRLATVVSASDLGTIGPAGTTDTSTIVIRFLDNVLGETPRLPSATALAAGVTNAVDDPFGLGNSETSS